jgi:hypothetical protein
MTSQAQNRSRPIKALPVWMATTIIGMTEQVMGRKLQRLVQKVYNKADLFIGRVFENAHASPDTATVMAKARNTHAFWF